MESHAESFTTDQALLNSKSVVEIPHMQDVRESNYRSIKNLSFLGSNSAKNLISKQNTADK